MPKIAFISDIHWRGNTRHAEYVLVFERLFADLRNNVKPDFIFVGGDIFHTKTQGITPEVIDRITWMFRGLAEIAPVYSILGNHDGNLTNKTRQDTITPIVDAMKNPRVTLFKKSGNHLIPGTDINLCVLSCFDEEGWSSVETKDNLINLALFHGSVKGCKTDSDWVMQGGEVDLSFFERFDFALLGDIHKSQFLGHRAHRGPTRDMKPWIGYPGSLIQQNYGEDGVKGYHVWDIHAADSWNVEFRQVHNPCEFLTLEWKDSVSSTIDAHSNSLKGKRVRVSSEVSLAPLQKKELYDTLKGPLHGAVEVTFKLPKPASKKTTAAAKHSHSLRNNPDELCRLFEASLKTSLSDDQLSQAKEFIRSSLAKVVAAESDDARDVIWSIKELEFGNLYRYGDGNKINFENLRGVTGIFGPNRTGKSSIIGALMFVLFNATDRGPVKSSYIINRNKKHGYAKARINVSGVDYIIERSATKATKRGGVVDEEKAATKLKLERLNQDGTTESLVNENADSRADTDKVIRKLIGTSSDFLMTAFSSQGGMNRFLEEGSTQRKVILNRFLDLDIFEKLYKMANDELSALNARAQGFKTLDWNSEISKHEQALRDCEERLVEEQEKLKTNKAALDAVASWLSQNGAAMQAETRRKHQTACTSLLTAKQNKGQAERSAMEAKRSCESLREKIEAARKQTSGINAVSLRAEVEKLKAVSLDSSRTWLSLSKEKDKLESQEKSVKKLDLVPCGNLFPSCKFIKDSHQDRAEIDSQRKLVESVLERYQELSAQVANLGTLEKELSAYEQLRGSIEKDTERLEWSEKHLASSEVLVASHGKEVEKLSEEIARYEAELASHADLDAKERERVELGREVSSAERSVADLYRQIGMLTGKLEQVRSEFVEAAKIIEQQRVFDAVATAFSKTGIPAEVLRQKLPEINEELQNILAGTVNFQVSLEAEVGGNSLDIYLQDKDSRRIIELCSGAEKMIASLAIRVALVNLSSLPKPDLFIQDEGWGVLDPEGLEKCLELLQSLKERFKAVLVISHTDEVKEAAGTHISITDLGSESRVVFS